MNKRTIFFPLLILVLAAFTACSEDDSDTSMPRASFTVSANEVSINQTVTFTYTGTSAKQVVFFPGDEGHEYSKIQESNTGLVMNGGFGTYAYKKAGTYTAVVVATNYDREGSSFSRSVDSTTVVVVDEDVSLESVILSKDLYNKELAADISDGLILVRLPHGVNVNNHSINVKLAQRMTITPTSGNATVTIDGEPFSEKTKYDLSKDHVVTVTAPSGNSGDYRLHQVYYPVFSSFHVNGVKGSVVYSAYDYDKATIDIALPKGTDVTRLSPVFTSAEGKSVTVNGAEQVSGTSVQDFSSPVTYVLSNADAEYPATTEIVVTVTASK